MVDKCSPTDWEFLEEKANEVIRKGLDDPTSPIYIARDYFVIYFDKVHPVDAPGLNDSYAFFFVLFLGSLLAVVASSTIYYFIQSKRRLPKSLDKHIEEENQIITDQFEDRRKTILKRSLLQVFDIRTNIKDSTSYVVSHPGQLAADLLHFIFSTFTFAYIIPFIEAAISKVTTDKVMKDFYNSGPEDSNIQMILFIPEGYLFISAYLCTLSAVRAFSRVEVGMRKQHWWRLIICYFKLIISRYLRLAFGVLLGTLFIWKILPIVLTGPLRYTRLGCTDENFFSTLFFWNNHFAGNDKRMCGSWYYFFAMAFRLYTVVPALVLLFLFGARKSAHTICAVLGLTSLAYTVYYVQHNGIREVHTYDGRWLAKVFDDTYQHAFSYFLGVMCALWQLKAIDGFVSKYERREGDPYFDFQSGRDLGSLANTVAQEQPSKSSGRVARPRLWEAVFTISLILFGVDYYIYVQYWQNDDVDIRSWPQWRHTLFNTFGVLILGLCPVFMLAAICFRVDQPLLKHFTSIKYFGLMRSSHYEMAVVGIPFLLVTFMALQAVPYFDDPMVNSSILWLTAGGLALSVFAHLVVFKPLRDLSSKIVGL
jgi:hypothetical protein